MRYVLETRRTFLADEQGLGKTVQALAALEADDAWPAIVVCPASLKLNWEREAARWLPHRSRAVVSGRSATAPAADLTILNYEIVEAHARALRARRPRALVLDESHSVKNPRAQRTRAVRRLADAIPRDGLRLALTGTPVMNHPDELIAQLRVLDRLGDFGSGARFSQRFRGASAPRSACTGTCAATASCAGSSATSSPSCRPSAAVVLPVALTNDARVPDRRARRDRVAADAAAGPLRAGREDRRRPARRAPGPARTRSSASPPAASWPRRCRGSTTSWPPTSRWSCSPTTRRSSEALLERFDALHLLGRDSQAQRDATVARFQAPTGPPLLVCSTRVAAQGITLTRATNVCFLELEWTPAIHDQAEDRVHRIGQHDAVTAWYLLAADTIDETMAAPDRAQARPRRRRHRRARARRRAARGGGRPRAAQRSDTTPESGVMRGFRATGSNSIGRVSTAPRTADPLPPSMREPARVLLIEDDEGDAFLVRELLTEVAPQIEITTVATLADAEPVAGEADCALLDLGLPDTQGLDGLVRLRRAAPDTPVLVLTGHDDTARGIEAVACGAHDYLVKGRVDGESWRARSATRSPAAARSAPSARCWRCSCRPRRTRAWSAACCPPRCCVIRRRA